MRTAYALIGLGFIILFAATYFINRDFTTPHDTGVMNATSTLALASPAFEQGGSLPAQYTCDGAHISPPLSISGAPPKTKSFALSVEDPDVPKAVLPSGLFVHWVLFNIPATTTTIAEGTAPGIEGANGSGAIGYTGPCPPPQYEPARHRYFFYLYALDTVLDLKAGATKDELMRAMQGHVLGQAEHMGTYQRQ